MANRMSQRRTVTRGHIQQGRGNDRERENGDSGEEKLIGMTPHPGAKPMKRALVSHQCVAREVRGPRQRGSSRCEIRDSKSADRSSTRDLACCARSNASFATLISVKSDCAPTPRLFAIEMAGVGIH